MEGGGRAQNEDWRYEDDPAVPATVKNETFPKGGRKNAVEMR
jgi:hypothetical protein